MGCSSSGVVSIHQLITETPSFRYENLVYDPPETPKESKEKLKVIEIPKTDDKIQKILRPNIKCLSNIYFDRNQSAFNIKSYYKKQKPFVVNESDDESIMFVDNIFPPNSNSLLGYNKEGKKIRETKGGMKLNINIDKVVWLRPSDIFEGEYKIFYDSIDPGDIMQGEIGDCYLMATLSAIAAQPQLIYEIFRTLEVNKKGYYELCLKIDGEWKIVIVDDLFPCHKDTKKPLFARPNKSEIWVMLIEKAWAKINKGYEYIVGGYESEILRSMVSFPFELIHLEKDKAEDKEKIWKRLLELQSQKNIMTTVTGVINTNVGIRKNHAYTLVSVTEITYKNSITKLLRIRNPWGPNTNYEGLWGKDSEVWTEKLKKMLDYNQVYLENEGQFWISYEDYLSYFVSITVCFIYNQICTKHKSLDFWDEDTPKLFEVKLYKKSEFTACLFKPTEINPEIPERWTLNSFIIMIKCEYDNILELSETEGSVNYYYDCYFKRTLEPGTYLFYTYANLRGSGNQVKGDVFKKIKTSVNFYSTELFDLHYHGSDKLLSFYQEAIINQINIEKKNKIKKKNSSDDITLKACYDTFHYYAYIFNNEKANVSYKLIFTPANISYLVEPKTEFVLAPNTGYLILARIQEYGKNTGLQISSSSVKTTDPLTDNLNCRLINTKEYEPNYDDLGIYCWFYKKKSEFNSLKSSNKESAIEYLTYLYPEEMKDLLNLSGSTIEISSESIFKEKVYFKGGDRWYLGEWLITKDHISMTGRGILKLNNLRYLGYFLFSKFTKGKLTYQNGDIIEGNFEDNLPKGPCKYFHRDGKIEDLNI